MLPHRLSRDLRLLITFGAFRTVSDLFLGAFFISFIMHFSPIEIVSVSTYKLFEYTATCVGFFLVANLVKKYSKRLVFALNLVPKILLLLAIIFLGDIAVEYVVPLGLLYGISAAMYHLPRHVITADMVSADKMGHFVGTKNAVGYLVKVIAPVFLGLFIDIGSYTAMAHVLLFASFIELFLMIWFKPRANRNANRTDFIGFYRCVSRFPTLRKMFLMEILRGFGLGLLGTVVTMYAVYIFHSDLNLGILTTVFSLCSVTACWIVRNICHASTYRNVLLVCVLLFFIAMSMFVYKTTPITFLIYSFIYSTAIVFMEQINNVSVYRLARSRCINDDMRIEYFVIHDFALFIGRWIGFVGLMYIGVFGGYSSLRWYLLLIGLAIIGWGLLNRNMLTSRK